MKTRALLALSLPALLVAAPPSAPAAPSLVEVQVNPAFELISVVFRLAGFREYQAGCLADYNAAVDAHFGAFKDHAAVALAKELRKKRVAYADGPYLAVRVKAGLGFEPTWDLKQTGRLSGSQWLAEDAVRFCQAMATFAHDTRAQAFFAAQAPFYARLETAFRTGLLGHLDQTWFPRTFGPQERDRFTAVLAPLNGGGNYGADRPNAAGGRDLFSFLGTSPAAPGQPPVFVKEDLPTLVHEFTHSFVNPWVDRHLTELQASGEALNAPVKQVMIRQAYGTGELALKESMVRAYTLRYLADHGHTVMARGQQHEEVLRGFYWVRPLEQLLKDTPGHLEAKTTQLVAGFKTWAGRTAELQQETAKADAVDQERFYAEGPQLLAVEPAADSPRVDPALSTFRLRFDRPMAPKATLASTGGEIPDLEGDGTWSEDGRVLSFPMKLKAATTYRFWVNLPFRHGFRDREGRPLRPTELTFTTGADPQR